ncbi:MAG: hypothetical protein K2K25_06930, partial [Muribaculaceae bacterium]|nr:hypothetical protein [Muribaculaceae bacterium]
YILFSGSSVASLIASMSGLVTVTCRLDDFFSFFTSGLFDAGFTSAAVNAQFAPPPPEEVVRRRVLVLLFDEDLLFDEEVLFFEEDAEVLFFVEDVVLVVFFWAASIFVGTTNAITKTVTIIHRQR